MVAGGTPHSAPLSRTDELFRLLAARERTVTVAFHVAVTVFVVGAAQPPAAQQAHPQHDRDRDQRQHDRGGLGPAVVVAARRREPALALPAHRAVPVQRVRRSLRTTLRHKCGLYITTIYTTVGAVLCRRVGTREDIIYR